MFPSSSIGSTPTTDPKAPNSILPVVVFKISFKKQYLRMTLMQSKDNKMYNFYVVYTNNSPQALNESLKELKERRL